MSVKYYFTKEIVSISRTRENNSYLNTSAEFLWGISYKTKFWFIDRDIACIIKLVFITDALLLQQIANNASLNRSWTFNFEIVGKRCFISRISLRKFAWVAQRVFWQNFAALANAWRFPFDETRTSRCVANRKGELYARWCHRIFPRDIILPSPPEEKSLLCWFCKQTDSWIILGDFRPSWLTLSKDYHDELLTSYD